MDLLDLGLSDDLEVLVSLISVSIDLNLRRERDIKPAGHRGPRELHHLVDFGASLIFISMNAISVISTSPAASCRVGLPANSLSRDARMHDFSMLFVTKGTSSNSDTSSRSKHASE
jgi:hypothetical protein